jgi:uncharacterized protein (DUF2342 family)
MAEGCHFNRHVTAQVGAPARRKTWSRPDYEIVDDN